ncbi:MAG: phosphatase PAP2 family protein [Candidatus Hermodarchaeota archaeon]
MTVEIISKIEEWDYKVFLSIYKSSLSKRKKLILAAKIYSFFGNIYFWGVYWLSMVVYGYITKDYLLLVLITGGFIQSIILHVIVRYKLVNRNRPFITLEKEGVIQHDDLIKENKSFPSGHVAFFLFFGIIFAYFYQSWTILIVFIVLDVIMAITRLILGVHFPTDVIAGFGFGILYALLYLYGTSIYWIMIFYWCGHTFSPILHYWIYFIIDHLIFWV